jgi:hypothetical protein
MPAAGYEFLPFNAKFFPQELQEMQRLPVYNKP